MGLISSLFNLLFGGGRNVVRDTAEVFMENREAASQRASYVRAASLGQFAAEFGGPRRGLLDRFMDALNRLPRPALALGTLGLFLSAMIDPVWFAERMQGVALVPEPLWWLMGAIVSFYFGARYQAKGQEFERSIVASMARVGPVTRNIAALRALDAGAGGDGGTAAGVEAQADQTSAPNPALDAWRGGA